MYFNLGYFSNRRSKGNQVSNAKSKSTQFIQLPDRSHVLQFHACRLVRHFQRPQGNHRLVTSHETRRRSLSLGKRLQNRLAFSHRPFAARRTLISHRQRQIHCHSLLLLLLLRCHTATDRIISRNDAPMTVSQ